MVERIYLVFEIVSALLILWMLHGSKKRPGICTIAYVCLELIITSMIAEGWISVKYIVFAYLGIVVVDIYEFNDRVKNGIIYTIADCLIMYIIQVLGALIYSILYHSDDISTLEVTLVSLFLLFILYFIFRKCNIEKFFRSFLELNFYGEAVIVIFGIILYIMLKHESIKVIVNWDLLVFLLLFLLIIILIIVKLEKERIQKNKFIEYLQQYEQYNEVYKDLISDIRHRQHDFDNHIQALYSMSISCENIEELRNEQKKYLDELLEDKHSYNLLKESVSSVLTAFLYFKLREVEEKGMNIYYNIHIDRLEKIIPFPDIVELVGNLLDNAVEATMKNSNKNIYFEIMEKKKDVSFILMNPYEWIEGENFNKFMVDGKSTKKETGHGFGLTNISKMVERYHGVIQVQFEYDQGVKVIRFEIVLPITCEGH
ncbi:MAG: GHKL domain-containing protein [Lachnospiraceae bacterium]|nr:GHKL domain-containing protein [Lachnospiraceae bacterium]